MRILLPYKPAHIPAMPPRYLVEAVGDCHKIDSCLFGTFFRRLEEVSPIRTASDGDNSKAFKHLCRTSAFVILLAKSLPQMESHRVL